MSNLSSVLEQGRQQTLQAMELMKKERDGTITQDERNRLAMLNGSLLALAETAIASGYNPLGGAPVEVSSEGCGDCDIDEEVGADEVGEEYIYTENDDYRGGRW